MIAAPDREFLRERAALYEMLAPVAGRGIVVTLERAPDRAASGRRQVDLTVGTAFGRANLAVGSALPFTANSLDCVILAGAPEGVFARWGRRAVLADIHRVLVPGGTAVLDCDIAVVAQPCRKPGRILANIGWRSCLRRAGFTDVAIYVARQSNGEKALISTMPVAAVPYYRESLGSRHALRNAVKFVIVRLLIHLSLLRLIEPSLLIHARKCSSSLDAR